MGARGPSAAATRPRGPSWRSTVKNGAVTGGAVDVEGPVRSSTRRLSWMWSGALACCWPVDDLDCGA